MCYTVNETTARHAKEMSSFSDYVPGSATAEYRAAVDEAAALVEAKKAKLTPPIITPSWTAYWMPTPAAWPTG